VGGTLLAEPIVLSLYGEEFASAIPVMRVLIWMVPPAFLSEILGRACSTMHLERKAVKFTVARVVFSITLNLVLIPHYGVMGAAIAAVVTSYLRNVLSSIVIGPAILWKGTGRGLLRVFCAVALMGVVVYVLRDADALAGLGPEVSLALLVVGGAVVYGVAALALGAIRPGEVGYLLQALRRRVSRSRSEP
jgi:O-antigen/teichoic acid export membrane protein